MKKFEFSGKTGGFAQHGANAQLVTFLPNCPVETRLAQIAAMAAPTRLGMFGSLTFFALAAAAVALGASATAFAQPVYYSPYPPGQYVPPGGYYAPYGTPPPYYYPPPQPKYVPPPPQPVYQPPPPPRPARGYWGISVNGSALHSFEKSEPAASFGLGLRLFSFISPLDAEFEVGAARYDAIERNDYRLGVNVHASFSKGIVVPYLVFPFNLHVADQRGVGTTLEGSIGAGAGLGVRIWRFMVSADARLHYQDDFDGIVQEDLVGEGRLTLTLMPWNL
ncbi:MAG: hypothetical protein IPK82_25260 [Polyangiaceae bacterium]|nr:hypothetical protein [Polyangiaceae bacterium]